MVDRNQSLISQDNNLILHHWDVEMVQARINGMKAEDLELNIADYVDLKQIYIYFFYHGWSSCFHFYFYAVIRY